MKGFRVAIVKLAAGLRFLGQLALASMVLTICYDVVMRYIFKAPTFWSLEVNTFLVVFITMLPAGDVLASGSHLRITFLLDRMGPGPRRLCFLLTAFLGTGFAAVMTWKGYQMAAMALRYDDRMSTPLGTPMFIPYGFIPVGFGIMGLYYLVSIFLGPEQTAPAPQQEV